jgi:hypothetical protein
MSPTVAVVAHREKTLGAGLDRLRVLVSEQDVGDLLWYEVAQEQEGAEEGP